jgi:glyoxylase-like metal-dependent hydrolase (beta-lactamase superfamily II)
MHTLTLGEVTISRITEIGRSAFPTTQMLPESDAGRIVQHHRWIKPHFFDDVTGDMGSRIQTWIVRTPQHTVLVDTGVGNDKIRHETDLWNKRQGGFLDDLRAAGVTPEQVDLVLCTHLHVDHVGWNTRLENGRWVPTFPRARYLFARREWEHWTAENEEGTHRIMGDSVAPVLDAGLAELVDMDHRVTDEIRLEPTPGHTPGHVSVRLASGGADAVITGDLMHHPVQIAEPTWQTTFDTDPAAAQQTRRTFCARYGDRPVTVLGTHFHHPTAGRIVKHGDTWRFALDKDGRGR